jgi:hypothetical protein
MPLPVPPAMEWQRVKPSRESQYSASRSVFFFGGGGRDWMRLDGGLSVRAFEAAQQEADRAHAARGPTEAAEKRR